MKKTMCFLFVFLFWMMPCGQANTIDFEGYVEELKAFRK